MKSMSLECDRRQGRKPFIKATRRNQRKIIKPGMT